MFQIGPSLREARTRRGLSPADVHKAVRIRERYLSALEEERWEMLPGDAYTKGFLRTYAEFLGLNGQLYIDEYNARIAVHEAEPLVPEALQKSRSRATAILFRTIGAVIVLGAAVAGLAAWRHAGTARPHVAAAEAAPKVVHAAPVAAPVVAKVEQVKQAPKAHRTKPVMTPKPTFTVIRAVRDRSWLSIRIGGPGGREVFRGTLERGRFLKYGLSQRIWVRMGRPLALDIRIGTALVTNLPSGASNLLLTKSGAR
jgi:cytoskeleton protein RodZ